MNYSPYTNYFTRVFWNRSYHVYKVNSVISFQYWHLLSPHHRLLPVLMSAESTAMSPSSTDLCWVHSVSFQYWHLLSQLHCLLLVLTSDISNDECSQLPHTDEYRVNTTQILFQEPNQPLFLFSLNVYTVNSLIFFQSQCLHSQLRHPLLYVTHITSGTIFYSVTGISYQFPQLPNQISHILSNTDKNPFHPFLIPVSTQCLF